MAVQCASADDTVGVYSLYQMLIDNFHRKLRIISYEYFERSAAERLEFKHSKKQQVTEFIFRSMYLKFLCLMKEPIYGPPDSC